MNHLVIFLVVPVELLLKLKRWSACKVARYCDEICQRPHRPLHKRYCKALSAAAKTEAASKSELMTTTSITSNLNTGSNNNMVHNQEGWVGLKNLGNTCFLNSAVQCMSHATLLTRLFLSNRFKRDLNTDNPLEMGGELAQAYATMMNDLGWRGTVNSTGTGTSVRALIDAIAEKSSQFELSGQQHDTQEFLACLLDGLHEDLNRIKNAQNVERSDVSANANMAVASADCWTGHKRWNNSVVLDTFYGQFRSICVCPNCNRASVSFDAYNYISLELPKPKATNESIAFQVLVQGSSSSTLQLFHQYGIMMIRIHHLLGASSASSSIDMMMMKHNIIFFGSRSHDKQYSSHNTE